VDHFRSLAYESADEVTFGLSPHPVRSGLDVEIGSGEVLPEVDFTLPPMLIKSETWPEVQRQYRESTTRVLARAQQLKCNVIGLEVEHLFEMTTNPEWGAALTQQVKAIMKAAYERNGMRSTLRVTVADIRLRDRPAKMRTGTACEQVLRSFDMCATSGADTLSIESTGGKEVFDEAILRADLPGIMYSLGILACRDVRFLWRRIAQIAKEHHVVAGGDTACAFGNTAMQLAHQNYIPHVLAALIRAASAPRTLCAFEEGATGPGKDCAYENPVIKIIAGVPIAMEGKSAACAHSSPLGNISAAACDLWTNESVQNVHLLGGSAPEVFTELLIYDCRLMNAARKLESAKQLGKLFVESDRNLDPQALFLDPEICFSLAKQITAETDDYSRTLAAARFACSTMMNAVNTNTIALEDRERKWLIKMQREVDSLPEDEDELWSQVRDKYGRFFFAGEYGLDR